MRSTTWTGTLWGRALVVIGAWLIGCSAVLLAQDASGVAIVQAPQLTSVGAVVIASIFGTSVVKRLLGNVPLAQAIPVWVYVTGLAIVFTLMGNKVFHTLDGDFWALAWSGVYNAAASSGFYEWVTTGLGKPMSRTVDQ